MCQTTRWNPYTRDFVHLLGLRPNREGRLNQEERWYCLPLPTAGTKAQGFRWPLYVPPEECTPGEAELLCKGDGLATEELTRCQSARTLRRQCQPQRGCAPEVKRRRDGVLGPTANEGMCLGRYVRQLWAMSEPTVPVFPYVSLDCPKRYARLLSHCLKILVTLPLEILKFYEVGIHLVYWCRTRRREARVFLRGPNT